jgi:glycosyltransferase involved in cell wall biosynthesis
VTSDASLAEALGRAGRRYVATELSWDVVLGRYEELLDRVVATAVRA